MKKLLIIILMSAALTGVKAQQKTITGTVIAKEDGQPIPGVTVVIKGTQTGTQTNSAGKYQLSAPVNGVLKFSFIGYTSREISIKNKDTINVILVASANSLNEVVVVGYGVKVKRNLTGSVTTISSKIINPANVTNTFSGLSGRVAGVNIAAPNAMANNYNVTANVPDESYKPLAKMALIMRRMYRYLLSLSM